MKIVRYAFRVHRFFLWIGLAGLWLFALSGMLHPLMSWTTVQPAAFFPPQLQIQSDEAARIPALLAQHGVNHAQIVTFVPSKQGALLQVTHDALLPRRYMNPRTGEELPDYDTSQAQWLARYYTGMQDTPIAATHFQTSFDDAYPWVNRLLPVYRVEFADEAHTTAFVYTELSALANLTNDKKTTLQGLFQTLHTWSWLDDAEYIRVALMLVLLVGLLCVLLSGIAMLITLRRRAPTRTRRIHRALSYIIALPLLMLCSSGIYHLLHYAGEPPRPLTRSTPAFSIPHASMQLPPEAWLPWEGISLNAVHLMVAPDGTLCYRLSAPNGAQGASVASTTRFAGMPSESHATYLSSTTGATLPLHDAEIAQHLAHHHGASSDTLPPSKVTHFSPTYDFRHKRLPVWQVNDGGTIYTLDPATSLLVDRLSSTQTIERYSFSLLHKWGMLSPLIGALARDGLLVLLLMMALISSLFGVRMALRVK